MNSQEPGIAQKYDLLGCIQCGRCTAGCPVSLKSGLNIRRLVRAVMVSEKLESIYDQPELWDCTTCSTCTLRCPRGVKPHELVIGCRGALIEEGRVPVTARDALEGVFKHGNPWGRIRNKRTEWAEGLNIKDFSKGDKAETLLFVGCAVSYDPRLQELAKAMVKILNHCGVDFGILGTEENCCGNEVRRMGEEGLFEMLVEDNRELFRNHGITRIVTMCPHGYNVFKNEYPDTDLEVKHHSQLLAELIAGGKLRFNGEVKKAVTYQDPCFLGKQNGVFDEPREILRAIPGMTFTDLDRSRERSLCCEGGGGRMWVEASDAGERLADIRVKQVAEIGADILATACPFCLLNLEDAVKTAGYQDRIEVRDITELLSMAL
ncbi:(Fe-S)-binding protein [Chloroflexota bacterium]